MKWGSSRGSHGGQKSNRDQFLGPNQIKLLLVSSLVWEEEVKSSRVNSGTESCQVGFRPWQAPSWRRHVVTFYYSWFGSTAAARNRLDHHESRDVLIDLHERKKALRCWANGCVSMSKIRAVFPVALRNNYNSRQSINQDSQLKKILHFFINYLVTTFYWHGNVHNL